MSHTPHETELDAALSVQRRADEVCLRFERAWKAGQRPAIEDFLGDTPEPERDIICRELVVLEVAYRRRAGENPCKEEYEARFPSLDLSHVLSPEAAPGGDLSATVPLAVGQSSVAGVRFRILHEHAEGALGKVFLAHDEELHRQVALKEIQEKYAHHPESRSRFLLEAEVTGGLEHPGIVPVYGLGRHADGRPYYAMRFIKGESFRDAIRRFHAADAVKRDPGERSLAFRELLGRFVDACNALAYAHARGVLHRDVKPHNIMLGKYGETLVVDWGLAKVVGHQDGPTGSEEGTLRPCVDGDTPPTQMGEIMGTPVYMSPEQAEGRLDELGPASDIYSLGATFYELLTGRQPFQGHNFDEILGKVKRGDWLPPRKVGKDVPAALESVCRKAMALRPEERYSTALELAADIEHWLADEPVAAYREPWPGRLGRWVRRHRGLTAGAAGLLMTAVVALVVGLVAVEKEKQRTELALHAEAQAKQRTRQALDDTSSQVLESWFSREKSKLAPAQEEFLKKLLAYYREFAQESGDSEEVRTSVAQAHSRIGIVLGNLGQHQAAEEAFRRAIDYYARLAADFPDVTAYRKELAGSSHNLGMQLAASGRLQEAEAAYRQALTIQKQLAAKFPAEPGYRLYLANHHHNLGNLLSETARPDGAYAAFDEAIALFEQLIHDYPGEPDYRDGLAGTCHSKAYLLVKMGRPREAEKIYRQSLALRKQLANDFSNLPDYQQRLAGIHNDFGDLLKQTGRYPEARDAFGNAITIQKQLVAEFPAVPRYRLFLARHLIQLGSVLQETCRHREAESAFREAVAVSKQLASDFGAAPEYRQQLAASHNNLGALLEMTQPKEAEAAYRAALTPLKQLVDEFPAAPQYRHDLAGSHNNLGGLLAAMGRLKEAETAYDEALRFQKPLVAEFPAVPRHRLTLARHHRSLGKLLQTRGRHQEAEEAYRAGRALLKELTAEFPEVPSIRQELAMCHRDLSDLLRERGRMQEAEATYREALIIQKRLAAEFPAIPAYRHYAESRIMPTEKLITGFFELSVVPVKFASLVDAA